LVQRLAAEWMAEGSEFESCYEQIFYLLDVGQTGSGVPQTVPPSLKCPGREVNHLTLSNAEFKNMWLYTSTPPYVFMA
jgi:hypothetical protein